MEKIKKIIKCVVKRRGQEQEFDERKVYASCYAACLSTRLHPQDAEKICEKVSKQIKSWLKNKKIVTSNQIFKKVILITKKYNKDVSFMYKTHRDIG